MTSSANSVRSKTSTSSRWIEGKNLLVCDTKNWRVQVLTKQGVVFTEFGKNLHWPPNCVHVDRDGRILVGDTIVTKGHIHAFAFDWAR